MQLLVVKKFIVGK